MAVNIEMSYAKKLGLPEYSSHQFSISLTAEVANLEDVPAEVERVYQILQASVDDQIVKPGFVPGGDRRVTNKNGHANNDTNGDTKPWRCSDKQRALILKIVGEHHLDRDEIEQLAISRFGHGVVALNKLEASGLIDELLTQTGRTSGSKGGGRNFQQRRAA